MSATRREFLKSSMITGAAAAMVAAPAVHGQSRAKRYRTALVGTGWWGMNILGEAVASGQCEVVGMCDVDESQLKGALEKLGGKTSDQPKRYADYRELLDREKPEICIVATPDHWHPLITIAAVKAGANVYVEKPIGHTVREGRAMIRAARDTGKVVQVGTHRRVSPHNVSGMDFLRSGKAGKIGMVRAFVHNQGGPEQPQSNDEPPQGLNWDMWCGPGPLRPYNAKIHPKGFRNFLDYANGTLGDWGIHWMDQILWWTDEKWPRRISSTGGRHIKGPAVNDSRGQTTDAPDTQVAQFEFESFTAVWEHRQYADNNAEKGENVGCYFYGTNGTFHQAWKQGWTFYPAGGRGQVQHQDPQLNQPDNQNIKELFTDFLGAIKDNKNGDKRRPKCDIEIAHRSTNMSLLGMLSLKLGRSLQWDGDKEVVVGDEEANRLLSREYRKPWEYPA
jgi:predicted dehydrogenase